MPGQRRARIIRRVSLPPDLRKEMKTEIRKIAAERANTVNIANKRYSVEEAKARIARNNSNDGAWEVFETEREKIVAEYHERAAQRRGVTT